MGRDKLAYFNQHVGGIAILSEPEISKRSLLRSTNVRSGLQFTALKFFSMSSFLLATEVVEKSYLTTRILVVLVCWVFADPSSTKQFFELCCHVTS